jgi:hypothetical protein
MASQFPGLTMPVFTAFGWAGEETALNFALSQLEIFIGSLHSSLSREAQAQFPFFGLDRPGQSVYLSTGENPVNSTYIAFYARPMSLEIALSLTDKRVLGKALRVAHADSEGWHRLVTELGPEWTLRLQQMEVDEETGATAHYQDIFKDSVDKLGVDAADQAISRAEFLNGEPKWVTPIFLSRRLGSEQAAAMGGALLRVMADDVQSLLPLVRFMSGQARKVRARAARPAGRPKAKEAAPTPPPTPVVPAGDQFTYVSELMPLHLRKGFINLTSQHWPFFELNARTETRPVTVYFDGRYDRDSAVWRLVPDDQARIMLSPRVREWMEDNFAPNDLVKITAVKLQGDEIQINLQPAE